MDKKLFSKQRILLLAHLRENGRTRFSTLKKEIRFPSDGNLAWHIKVLEKLGYVKSYDVEANSSKKVAGGHKIEVHIDITKKGIKGLEEFNKFIRALIPEATVAAKPIAA